MYTTAPDGNFKQRPSRLGKLGCNCEDEKGLGFAWGAVAAVASAVIQHKGSKTPSVDLYADWRVGTKVMPRMQGGKQVCPPGRPWLSGGDCHEDAKKGPGAVNVAMNSAVPFDGDNIPAGCATTVPGVICNGAVSSGPAAVPTPDAAGLCPAAFQAVTLPDGSKACQQVTTENPFGNTLATLKPYLPMLVLGGVGLAVLSAMAKRA